MTGLYHLTVRNSKLFFKDKGMFFSSLITPIILLVLYIAFLKGVFESSFVASVPEGVTISQQVINGMVGGQLVASLLAVCCITVGFCSNMLMVQDKVNKSRLDLTISPVKRSTLAISYYLASLISTLIMCFVAAGACFIYLAVEGWFLSFADIILMIIDVILLTMFGTALSSFINVFLKSQGQISAVGTIVCAGYGFICGAYMPISQFGAGLRNALAFLPGTYGTSLIKNHALGGVLNNMQESNVPSKVIEGIRDSVDCNIYFFGEKVEIWVMYLILIGATLLLIGGYVLASKLLRKKRG